MKNYFVSHQKQVMGTSLFVLLLIRFVDGLLPKTIWVDKLTLSYVYVTVTFVLLALIIWLDRENLVNLNIDQTFISFFAISTILFSTWFSLEIIGSIALGIAFTIWIWSALFGIVIGIIAVIVLVLRRSQKLILKANQGPIAFLKSTFFGILPVLIFRFLLNKNGLSIFTQGFSEVEKTGQIAWIIVFGLWGVVFEEMLFRGMFWSFLRERNFGDGKILIIQAVVFWICHLNLISRSSFWFGLPLMSLWLGFLVKRYKSLTPSTITHFAYNFISVIMRTAM
ncbi:MAG: CPBP family intramembrane metalloprotease [Anaerolineaceae bacterium]|nr:MAG: CPBP family intramembrane metalloprotease [Anaerolineaceae bacterium]